MEDIKFQIRKNYKDFRPSEKKVADFLLAYEKDYKELTITMLAEEAGVSQPTIIRFTNRINLKGFKELKYLLIHDEMKSIEERRGRGPEPLHGFPICEKDELENVPSNIISTTIKIMKETLQSIDIKEFERLVHAILEARQVFIFGVENSNCTVNDLVTKLLYLGIRSVSYEDYYLQSICASNLTKEDVAIGISYSGYSKNTLDVLKVARETGAVTVAITNFEKTLLNEYADINIVATTEQYMYGDAIFSRTSQLAIVDMIYTGILVSDYTQFTKKIDQSTDVICHRDYRKSNNRQGNHVEVLQNEISAG